MDRGRSRSRSRSRDRDMNRDRDRSMSKILQRWEIIHSMRLKMMTSPSSSSPSSRKSRQCSQLLSKMCRKIIVLSLFTKISQKDGYKIKSTLQEVIDHDLDLDEGVAKGQEANFVTVEQGVEEDDHIEPFYQNQPKIWL
jgi:hypothetical protein